MRRASWCTPTETISASARLDSRATLAKVTSEDDQPSGEPERRATDANRTGEHCAEPLGEWMPVVDHSRCEAHEDCVVACPYDVLELKPIEAADWSALGLRGKIRLLAQGRLSAYATGVERCRACGLCVQACPEQAISLRSPRAEN